MKQFRNIVIVPSGVGLIFPLIAAIGISTGQESAYKWMPDDIAFVYQPTAWIKELAREVGLDVREMKDLYDFNSVTCTKLYLYTFNPVAAPSEEVKALTKSINAIKYDKLIMYADGLRSELSVTWNNRLDLKCFNFLFFGWIDFRHLEKIRSHIETIEVVPLNAIQRSYQMLAGLEASATESVDIWDGIELRSSDLLVFHRYFGIQIYEFMADVDSDAIRSFADAWINTLKEQREANRLIVYADYRSLWRRSFEYLQIFADRASIVFDDVVLLNARSSQVVSVPVEASLMSRYGTFALNQIGTYSYDSGTCSNLAALGITSHSYVTPPAGSTPNIFSNPNQLVSCRERMKTYQSVANIFSMNAHNESLSIIVRSYPELELYSIPSDGGDVLYNDLRLRLTT